MIAVLTLICVWIGLAGIHESGHLLCALILRLKIQAFGYQMSPMPSFFVSIKRSEIKWKNVSFLFAGNLATLLLFIVMNLTDLLNSPYLIIAFTLQFIVEYNPFYSDITIIISKAYNDGSLRKIHNSYYKTYKFASTLACWILFVCVLIFLNF